jgi:hypothetical protein
MTGKMKLVGGGGCPEQYDAFLDGEQVGYLRLRHGHFTVECPDCGGCLVYEADPEGQGAFDDEERDYYLRFAVNAIHRWIADGRPAMEPLDARPPAPDVEYEREGKGWGEA